MLVFAVLAVSFIWAWQRELEAEAQLSRSAAEQRAVAFASDLSQILQERVDDTRILAAVLSGGQQEPALERFRALAERTVEQAPSFALLNYVGADGIVKASVAGSGVQPVTGAAVGDLPGRAELHGEALETGRSICSPPMQLLGGQTGMVCWAPVRRRNEETGAEQPAGMVAGVFHVDGILRRAAGRAKVGLTQVSASANGVKLWESAGSMPLDDPNAASVEETVQGRRWRIAYRLPADDSEAYRPAATHAALAVHLLLSAALGTLSFSVVVHWRSARRAERQYRAVFDSAADALLVHDRSGRILDANNVAGVHMGHPADALRGMNISDIVPEDEMADFDARVATLDREGSVFFESEYRTRDHRRLPVEVHARPIRYQGTDAILAVARVMTDRLRAEQEVRAGRQWLAQVVDGSPVPMFVVDAEHRVTHWNQALSKISGIPAEEVIGTREQWRAFYPTERPVMADLILTGEESEVERFYGGKYQHAALEGAYEAEDFFPHLGEGGKWMHFTASPIRDDDGRIVGAIETLEDITERKEAEAALQAGRERLRAVVNSMPVLLDAFDEEGRIIFWNRECERVTGYTSDEMVNNPRAMEWLYPDPEYRAWVMDTVTKRWGDFDELDFELTCKDGSKRTVAWSNVSNRTGIPGWATWATGVDVTQRKLAEEELRRSEERYRLLAESMTDVVWTADLEFNITYITPSIERFRGVTPEERVHSKFEDFLTPDSQRRAREAMRHKLAQVAAEPEAAFEPVRLELEFLNKQGDIVWGEVVARFLRGEDGRPEAVHGVTRDITDRKRAEQELRQSRNFLEGVFTSIQDGISVLDRDLTIRHVNPVMERWYAPSAPLVGKKCFHCYHGADKACEPCPSIRCMKTGRTEMDIVPGLPGSSVEWIELYAYPMRDAESGEITGVIEFVRDVTEQKKAERELEEARALLWAAFESTQAGILVADAPDVRIRFANSAALGIRGATPTALTGIPVERHPRNWQTFRPDGEIVAPEDLPLSRAVLNGETVRNAEVIIRDEQGRDRWVLANAAPVRRPDGSIAAGVVVFSDISDRKEAEEALRRNERRYRHVVEGSPVPMLIHQDEKVVFANAAAGDTLGYGTDGELVGLSVWDFVHADSVAAARVRIDAAYAGHPQPLQELSFVRRDGARIEVQVVSTPIDHEGRPASHVAFQDVTERRHLEEQLARAQRMEAIGRLAGGVAHDFNNQLTVINGYCDLELAEMSEDAPMAGVLKEIRKAGERSSKLASQLLAFGRRQALRPEVIDLNEVVAGMDRTLGRALGEDIQIRTIPSPIPALVEVDRGQTEQALMNLAINARDAMPDGGKLTIETRETEISREYEHQHPDALPGRYVMLAVSDTGTGMDAETQQSIFDPFFTTKEPGKGTGLGLSMVYGFVKQSGGLIYVYSEVGRGTTFKIYLPRASGAPTTAEVRAPAEAPLGSETVLVAEDDESVRQLLVRVLRNSGYTVLETANADEALPLGLGYEQPIHLLIADVVMPGMFGTELAQRLRKSRPDMKVLFISGYTNAAARSQNVLRPGENLLSKPFSPETLAHAVRRVLDEP